jgi:hypothetical protein
MMDKLNELNTRLLESLGLSEVAIALNALNKENAALNDKASRFDELMNKMIEGYDKQVEKLEQQLAEAQTAAEKYRTLYFNTLNRYEYFKYHKPDVLEWEGKEGEG